LKQTIFEIRFLKRAIDFMMEENIQLKNRVAEIPRNGFSKKMLVVLEIFQNRFINEDQLIGLLRNELAQIEQLLHQGIFSEDPACTELCNNLKQLHKSIITAENQVIQLNADFNDFLQ